MGVRFPSVFTTTVANPLPASAAETVVLVTPPLTLPLDFASVFIFWSLPMNAGTGTTAWVIRVRRGVGLTGTDITGGGQTHTIAAGNGATITGIAPDVPGAVAGQQYAITVSQTGATAAGVAGFFSALAFAL